jgi:hypothetical protein
LSTQSVQRKNRPKAVRLTLLPIPDELIRSVAAKQLGEFFNLLAAISGLFGE